MQNLIYFVTVALLIISVLSLYFLIKLKDRLKDLGTKLNLLEDQQAKDKQSIIETLNSQYTDVMLAIESLKPKEEPEFDPSKYYEQAKDIVIKSGQASATLLQRRLKIGYANAAGILDHLEEQGIVGPSNGVKPRKVNKL